MGNDQTKGEYGEEIRLPVKGQRHFKTIEVYEDGRYGTLTLVSDPKLREFCIKDVGVPNQVGFQQSLAEKCERHKKHFFKFILPLNYYQKEIINGQTCMRLIFPYLKQNLEQIIMKKAKNGRFVQEGNMWLLCHSLISAGSFLHQHRINHGDVRPHNVHMNKRQHLLLVNPMLLKNEESQYNQFIRKRHSVCTLAPEEMAFLKNKISNPDYDLSQAQVFQTGMTLLQAATTTTCSNAYDWLNVKLNKMQIKSYLLQAAQQYPRVLVDIISRMLIFNPHERVRYEQILMELQPYMDDIKTSNPFNNDYYKLYDPYNLWDDVQTKKKTLPKKRIFSHPDDTTFLEDPIYNLDETLNPRVVIDQHQPSIKTTKVKQAALNTIFKTKSRVEPVQALNYKKYETEHKPVKQYVQPQRQTYTDYKPQVVKSYISPQKEVVRHTQQSIQPIKTYDLKTYEPINYDNVVHNTNIVKSSYVKPLEPIKQYVDYKPKTYVSDYKPKPITNITHVTDYQRPVTNVTHVNEYKPTTTYKSDYLPTTVIKNTEYTPTTNVTHQSYKPEVIRTTDYKPQNYEEYKPKTYTNPQTTVITNSHPVQTYTNTLQDYSPKVTSTIDYNNTNYKEYKPKEYKQYEAPKTNTYISTDTKHITKSPVRTRQSISPVRKPYQTTTIENSSYQPTLYNNKSPSKSDKLNDMINQALTKSDTNLTYANSIKKSYGDYGDKYKDAQKKFGDAQGVYNQYV